MQIYALPCGNIEFARHLFFPESPVDERMTIPVVSFLIRHPKGNVLFDTGVHPDVIADPFGSLGQRIASQYNYIGGKNDNVVSQLQLLGLATGDISHVINSHLHFDHCGANEFFPKAVFIVQKREMESVRGRNDPFQIINIDHPGEYLLIDGDHDLFADGRIQLLSTFGHSPGHQSLLLTLDRGKKVLLAADACYTREHLDGNILPATFSDAKAAMATLSHLRQLEEKEQVHLYFGHDGQQWGYGFTSSQLLG